MRDYVGEELKAENQMSREVGKLKGIRGSIELDFYRKQFSLILKPLVAAKTKNAVWFDILNSIFSGPDDPNYVVCKVTPYRIEYYLMNMPKPEVWGPRFS